MRRSRVLVWFGAALGAVAFALGVSLADQLIGVGSPYWASGAAASTTTDAILDRTDAGASRDALFFAGTGEAYRMAVVEAHGAMRVAWVLTATAVLDANCAITSGVVHGGTGSAACKHFPETGGEWHTRPNWAELRNRPGGARGICSVAHAVNHSGESLRIYPPCNIDGNCTTLVGSGTCTLSGWSSDQLARVGAYLIHDADTGTPQINVRKEIVAR